MLLPHLILRMFIPKRVLRILAVLLCAACLLAARAGAALAVDSPSSAAQSTAAMANEVMTLVNQLREERGLSALNVNPILMQVAQGQADYSASIGSITHYSADGSRPFQRALAAGFPVAGDLSQGGFYSENIMYGSGLTPQAVVSMWTVDSAHLNTMLSVNRSDMGAGVASDGESLYFVLDTALASNMPVQNLLATVGGPTEIAILMAPVVASTPAADGSIYHTVQGGQTLWTIAAVYGLKVEELALLNRLNSYHFIHPGDRLTIRPANTFTPVPPPTRAIYTRSASTAAPSSTALPNAQPRPQSNTVTMIAVVSVAMALAAVVTVLVQGRREE